MLKKKTTKKFSVTGDKIKKDLDSAAKKRKTVGFEAGTDILEEENKKDDKKETEKEEPESKEINLDADGDKIPVEIGRVDNFMKAEGEIDLPSISDVRPPLSDNRMLANNIDPKYEAENEIKEDAADI